MSATGPVALVRRPGPRLADGLVTHIERRPVDPVLAERQWQSYVEVLVDAGWDVVEVAPADDCPDAVFVEDALVVVGDLAVVTRPGAPTRRAETAGAAAAARALGLDLAAIGPPGTLDGGDVLQVGDTIHVGLGGRTDAAGIAALRDLVGPRGATVVEVPVRSVLHLKSAVTALPDGTVIGFPPLVDEPGRFPGLLAVAEPAGGHVVHLGGDRLLMASSCPATTSQLRALGWEVTTVDIGEYEKLEGCVTCLSVRMGPAISP
ncbi:MAG: arginine deiminase family protein [Actinomycetota bacterium]|nr:arginine deiminase family protein [Actinomycetota bacterium]